MSSNIDLIQTNATAYASVDLELRPISGAASGQDYDLFEVGGAEWRSHTVNSINHNNGVWSDVGASHPGYFYASNSTADPGISVAASSATADASNQYIHIWKSTGTVTVNDYMGYFNGYLSGGINLLSDSSSDSSSDSDSEEPPPKVFHNFW